MKIHVENDVVSWWRPISQQLSRGRKCVTKNDIRGSTVTQQMITSTIRFKSPIFPDSIELTRKTVKEERPKKRDEARGAQE